MNEKASPFIKWVGGKRGIMSEILRRIPSKFDTYYEPMVGGGALLYEIYDKGKTTKISDLNTNLITTYSVVKKDVHGLIDLLKYHEANHSKEYYYNLRSKHRLGSDLETAARFIYLNKTCYNGLYRVNRKGEFNVPIGSYKCPCIVQEENLILCNAILQNVIIDNVGYLGIQPRRGDFVYFDPPYDLINSASFTSYQKEKFTTDDQIQLRDFALELADKGVKIMISNSNTEFICDLYKNFNVEIIKAPRSISCKSSTRKDTEEVIITNYDI